MLRWLLAALLLISASAHADVTLYNFNSDPAVPEIYTRITEHDVAGNAMDAHSGHIMQDGGYFYQYGEYHGGGLRYKTPGSSPPTGFSVYRSTDLVNWVSRGFLLDPASAYAIANCTPAVSTVGCFRPHVLKNVANNNYVFWYVSFDAGAGVYSTTCTLPDDATTCGTPTVRTTSHTALDFTVFVDPSNNNGYVVYHASIGGMYIEALDSTYTIPQGSAVLVAATAGGGDIEAPFAFVRNGKTNIGFGGLCEYCAGGATTFYAQASTPLGVYGAPIQIDTSNACHSQSSANVSVIDAGGSTTYLYSGDAWTSQGNQGWADKFVYPLAFTGDAINTITCPTSVTIPGVTLAGTYPTPNNFPAFIADQSDTTLRGVFNDLCFVNSTTWSLQTFVPTSANLYGVGMALARNYNNGANPMPDVDGSVVVSLVNLDGSNNPTTTIGSVSTAASTLPWATRWKTLVFNATLTPGTAYGIVTKGSAMTSTGCFTETYSRYSNVYPTGVHKFSTNSGSTWTLFPDYALMFATYTSAPPALPGAAGRRMFH